VKPVLSRLIVSGLLLGFLGLASCQSNPSSEEQLQLTITPIGDLNAQTTGLASVYVRGTVRDRAPLLNSTAYQIQDNTGQVWVVTNNSPPESGQTLTIQAKIKSKSIVLQQQHSEEVYLQELRQLP